MSMVTARIWGETARFPMVHARIWGETTRFCDTTARLVQNDVSQLADQTVSSLYISILLQLKGCAQ